MIRGTFKSKMTIDELHDYFKNWCNEFNGDNCKLENTIFYIRIATYGDKAHLIIYSHGIEIGTFEPDNGCIWGDRGIYAYYPIIKFNNKLNETSLGTICNSANIIVEASQNKEFVITDDLLIDCIKKSYKYLEIY